MKPLQPQQSRALFLGLAFISSVLLWSAALVSAQEFTSDGYRVLNPVMQAGGYGSSDHFQLFGVISQMAIGTSTSLTFGNNAGFLYFPFVSTPVVTTTPGDTEVALSWTSADASTGWAVGGYTVGHSTISGGPYTYTDVGSSLSSTRTGLTNGTTYYFVIRVIDGLGSYIATSTQVSATPVASGEGGGGTGGGGGGGGGGSATGAIFSGMAYPGSNILLLKDGQIAASTIAGGDARFKIHLTGLSAGNFNFLIYATDNASRRSTLLTFPIILTTGATTEINGIFIAPTIAVDKEEVKKGDNLAILGQSVPEGEVTISIHSNPEIFVKAETDKYGGYVYNLDSSVLDFGDHLTKSKGLKVGEISPFGHSLAFKVGNKTVLAAAVTAGEAALEGRQCNSIADFNNDCRVNLVDYSILAFWYKKASAPVKFDLNHDGVVTIIDVSIMAYYWTG